MSAHPAAGSPDESQGGEGRGGQERFGHAGGNTTVDFVVALHQSEWEAEFFQHLTNEFAVRGSFKRCVDTADLVADVLAGLVGTVIVDSDFAGLDASTITHIAMRTNLVGLCSDFAGESRLRQWGVDEVVLLTPGDLQQTARSVMGVAFELQQRIPGVQSPEAGIDRIPTDASALSSDGELTTPQKSMTPGRKVVVFGATAGSGSTTVATGLAESLAVSHGATSLIDLDLDAPMIADNLALADDPGGLLRACRLAERGVLASADLAQTARGLDESLRLLVGLPAPHRRPEVKPVALTRVLEVASTLDHNVVVDLGSPWVAASPMVDGRELHYSLSIQDEVRTQVVEQLGFRDVLVAVVDCSPVAIAKATVLVGQVAKLAPEAAYVIAINRVRKTLLSSRDFAELVEVIAQSVPGVTVTKIRHDLDTADKAQLAGQTLHEANSKSVAVEDLTAMANQLVKQIEFV